MSLKSSKKITIAMVSGLTPEGHYTNTLLNGYTPNKNFSLVVYTDKVNNLKNNFEVKEIWKKNASYFIRILIQLFKDHPHICHYQHEINMFGPKVTAVIFPFLIILTKLIGIKVICTVHATVSQKQINAEFLETFSTKVSELSTLITKSFFYFLYSVINLFSNQIIVHTEYAKNILLEYPFANKNKITVIAHPFPNSISIKLKNYQKGNNLLYFGYFAKRKGLMNLLRGYHDYINKHPKSNVKLFLAGGTISGQEEVLDQINDFIKTNDLKSRIIYLGFQAKLDEIYKLANIVLLPSSLVISSSGPMCHALSRSKLILVGDNPYIREELEDKYNCLIVKNNNWENAINKILEDSQLRERILRNLSKIQLSRSSTNIFKLHEKLYLNSL